MASRPSCATCGKGFEEKLIDLSCNQHFMCKTCFNSKGRRVKDDLFSCETCDQFSQADSTSATTPCVYVYMDNSNIWIEAKKLLGTKGKEDRSIRIDVGCLLDVVAKGRSIAQANLYGSEPPPVDSVWKIAKEKGWNVIVNKRSILTDKEKQVDTQLVADVTKVACKTIPDNKTIIFISGDADIIPAITATKEEKWNAEVYMWRHALSRDLIKLGKEIGFDVNYLDDYKDKITFNSMKFPIANNKDLLDKVLANGVVCKMMPNAFRAHTPAESWCNEIKRRFSMPFRFFWMEELDTKSKKSVNNLLVLVFEELTPGSFKIADFVSAHTHEPIARVKEVQPYLTYDQKQKESVSKILYTVGTCTSICNVEEVANEIMGLAKRDSEESDDDDFYSVASGYPTEDHQQDHILPKENDKDDDWHTVRRKKKKKKNCQLYSKVCNSGIYCCKGSNCEYDHSEKEKEYFRMHKGHGKLPIKTKPCKYHPKCPKPADICKFAHGEKDAHCLECKKTGHFASDCDNKK